MQHDFWHDKWEKNQIGFHLAEANPLLVEHFTSLNLKQDSRVFIPLCGKTLDIGWMLVQGYSVVGAELSQIAVESLFAQLQITPNIAPLADLIHYQAENIDIFVGDIFKLAPEQLGKVDAVYDRAALVALPEEMRKDYSAHILKLTNHAPQLLICFEYDQAIQAGPPFSISVAEAKQHYQQAYTLDLLATVPVEGGLKGRCPALEHVWWLKPN